MSNTAVTSGSHVTTLTPLHAHLVLALSAQENLLISLAGNSTLSALLADIRAFCSGANIGRSSHVVSVPKTSMADKDIDALLSEILDASKDVRDLEGKQEQTPRNPSLPSVLVIPRVDELSRSTQATLKDVLRDKAFTIENQSYFLPQDFVCIATVGEGDEGFDGAGISRHLVNTFYQHSIYEG